MSTTISFLESRPGQQSLTDLLTRAEENWPLKPALIFDSTGDVLTFSELARRVRQVATGLATRLNVQPGDRVAVMLANTPQFPVTWLALAELGAITVPVNRYLGASDLAALLDHADASVIITDDEHVEAVRGCSDVAIVTTGESGLGALSWTQLIDGADTADYTAAAVTPETIVNIQFTSGSTGKSKGCALTQGYWVEIARTMATHGPKLAHSDILLTAQPFYYMDPMWNLAASLAVGSTLVVADRFHPKTFWKTVREHDVTYFYCLGVMPTMLLNTTPTEDDRDNVVRYISCSAIPAGRLDELESRFGAPWHELYGSTETGIDIMVDPAEHNFAAASGTLGRLVPNREIRIVNPETGLVVPRGEPGHLFIRGTYMSEGYFSDDAGNAEAFSAGWYRTGDIASQDADGFVYFHGRTKDVIRRSGENISAAQIEQVLDRHPAVDVAACLPVADEVRGEEIKVYIATTHEPESVVEELVDYAQVHLAYFKIPRFWEFRLELPMTPSEKVAKGEIRLQSKQAGICFDRVNKEWVDSPHH